MVRLRYPDSLQIQVTGPTSLLPTPKTHLGRPNMTWIHFLNDICELKLDADCDYFICTLNYSTKSEGGWTASLTDTIKDFISKFTRKRNKYCVRLHTGARLNASTSSVAAVAAVTTSTGAIEATSPWVPSILRKSATKTTTAVKKFATIVPLTPAQLAAAQAIALSTTSNVCPQPSVNITTTQRSSVSTFIQPIISTQQQKQQQMLLPNNVKAPSNARSKPQGNRVSTPKKRRIAPVSSDKVIREFSLRVRTGRDTCAPPKLSRFDDEERVVNGKSNSEPQPGPSNAFQQTTAASSSARTKRHETRSASRFTEVGDSSRVRSVTELVSLQLEPIVIDLEELVENEESNNSPMTGFANDEEIRNVLGIEEDDDEDDNASVCTAVEVEEREMRNYGIRIENIKEEAERRLETFDESMLQAIRKEIRKLRRSGDWARNVKRSPLACYMLLEMFKNLV